jgi:potassium/chloride transporter 4/5/6
MANTLQAIAKDGIIPFLKPFEVKAANGEPIRALGITLCICQVDKTFFLRR